VPESMFEEENTAEEVQVPTETDEAAIAEAEVTAEVDRNVQDDVVPAEGSAQDRGYHRNC
jgi:hypothetical protein